MTLSIIWTHFWQKLSNMKIQDWGTNYTRYSKKILIVPHYRGTFVQRRLYTVCASQEHGAFFPVLRQSHIEKSPTTHTRRTYINSVRRYVEICSFSWVYGVDDERSVERNVKKSSCTFSFFNLKCSASKTLTAKQHATPTERTPCWSYCTFRGERTIIFTW